MADDNYELVSVVVDPIKECKQPESVVVDPIKECKQLESVVVDPVKECKQPESVVVDPVKECKQPESVVVDPVKECKQPESVVVDPVKECNLTVDFVVYESEEKLEKVPQVSSVQKCCLEVIPSIINWKQNSRYAFKCRVVSKIHTEHILFICISIHLLHFITG